MANAYLGRDDWSRGATVTATNEDSGFPAQNLVKENYGKRFENSTSPNSFTITVDRGTTDKTIRAVGLFGLNVSSSAVWIITASNDPTFASVLYTSSVAGIWSATDYDEAPGENPANGFHKIPVADLSADVRYLRVQIFDSGLTTFRADHLMVSSDDPFTDNNIAIGSSYGGMVDRSLKSTTSRGRVVYTQGHIAKRSTLKVSMTSSADIDKLLDIYETHGGSRAVMYLRDPSATTRHEQCMFRGNIGQNFSVEQVGHTLFRASMTIEEQ